ncbi:hypothetical protein GGR51DRAFT_565092 [Nemania sp. FL0031]|nr:hypothetical protein GGR51DRAFT_565092 [Nemania sp. FL0031]
MASPIRKVLVAGIRVDAKIPEHFRRQFGTPEEVGAKIGADLANARQKGFDCTPYQLDPTRLEEQFATFEAELSSGRYDAIMIGAGVRLVPEHTALFERMVDACRRLSPGVPFVFNSGPTTHCEALERAFSTGTK